MALALIPLTVFGAATLMFSSLRSAEQLGARVERSYETREQVQRVFSLLQDAETGQRGFIITGKEAFLEPYSNATARLDAQLRVLDAQFSDHPEQKARLDLLRRQIDAKSELMTTGIALRRSAGATQAAEFVSSERGKRAMDAIRLTVTDMVSAESIELETQLRLNRERRQQVQLAALLLVLLLLGVLGGAAAMVARHNRNRQRLLEQVEQESTRQRTVFDSTMDALVTLNPSGSIETCNTAAERMFGYERSELIRRDSSTLVDFAEGEGLFLRRLALRGDPALSLPREFTARRKDGSMFPVEVALGAMRLRDGVHLVAALRDITERKEAERLKDEFVSTVSHELRTPLTSIAGSLGLLQAGAAGQLPEKAGRLVHIAKASCDRLVRLINDLLDMQKIASGKIQPEYRQLDLRKVAEVASESISSFASERQVRIEFHRTDEPVTVRGDEDRLVQIAVNLLSNAVKFSPQGARVELRVERTDDRATLLVRDEGPGVPESFQALLFRRFAQADGSAVRSVGGSGLGLAISREIAELHHGVLELAESSAQGAVFALTLPIAAPERSAAPPAAQVLICEPDAKSAAALREALEQQGFTSVAVGAVEEAEAALRSHRYRALLMGLRQTDGNGLSLAQSLRADPELDLPPVIIVAGEPGQAVSTLPIADWITTPIEPERLQRAVAGALGQRRSVEILHVDDDVDLTDVVAAALEGFGEVRAAHSLAEARQALASAPDLVILDIALPDGSGLDLLPDLQRSGTSPPVIIYSGQEIDSAVIHKVEAVLTKSRVSFDALTRTVKKLARPVETAG
ncbi:CHASE3 domain-containing protein [Phenylobacterium sp.]|jgi:PAS domain S-box-containing protein|uniref:CHASE3 domain-containing protein n=1 Tax=Phenylobacterium sp. TaxID=1871053 RepID=UPI002F929229